MHYVPEYSPAKTGEYLSNIPQSCVSQKNMTDNKHNSLHLTLKLCSDIYPNPCSSKITIFLKLLYHKTWVGLPIQRRTSNTAFTLYTTCSLLRTDNVHGQISEHIFMPNGLAITYLSRAG